MERNIDRVVELIDLGFISLAGFYGGSVLNKMILRWTEGKMSQLKTGYCSKSRDKVGENQTDNVIGSLDSRDTFGSKSTGLCLWILGVRERQFKGRTGLKYSVGGVLRGFQVQ